MLIEPINAEFNSIDRVTQRAIDHLVVLFYALLKCVTNERAVGLGGFNIFERSWRLQFRRLVRFRRDSFLYFKRLATNSSAYHSNCHSDSLTHCITHCITPTNSLRLTSNHCPLTLTYDSWLTSYSLLILKLRVWLWDLLCMYSTATSFKFIHSLTHSLTWIY